MSPSEALLAFVLELTRASKDLHMPTPPARIEAQPAADVDWAWAFTTWTDTTPAQPQVALTDLGVLTYARLYGRWETRQQARRWIRCIARHEASHVYLHHYSGGPEAEIAVAAVMREHWHEPSAQCDR